MTITQREILIAILAQAILAQGGSHPLAFMYPVVLSLGGDRGSGGYRRQTRVPGRHCVGHSRRYPHAGHAGRSANPDGGASLWNRGGASSLQQAVAATALGVSGAYPRLPTGDAGPPLPDLLDLAAAAGPSRLPWR